MTLLAGLTLTGPVWSAGVTESSVTGQTNVRAAFLARPAGARSVGMGEAFTASADDASALSWNPGALTELEAVSAVATYDDLGTDLGSRYLAAAMPVGVGVAGIGITQMSYGSYESFDALGNRTGIKSLSDYAVSAGWGIEHPLWGDNLGGTGVSVEAIREAVGGRTRFGLGAGGLYGVARGITVGIAAQHLGAAEDGKRLPGVVRAGVAWEASRRVRVATEAVYALVEGRLLAAAGVEAWPSTRLAFRAGYKQPGPSLRGGFAGFTGGIGFRLAGFELDYAYQPFGSLLTSHRVGLTWGRRATGGGS